MQLRILRKRKLLTQLQLAKLLNCSIGCISLWEAGKSSPNIMTMRKLADVLEVDLNTIVNCFLQNEKDQV
ncbi:MAG: helix-turn-helix transcriptional regulator [Clostridia bacterium]|nr:helix-turn-helix transcriptional regulator [Clostridia bacterium]